MISGSSSCSGGVDGGSEVKADDPLNGEPPLDRVKLEARRVPSEDSVDVV